VKWGGYKKENERKNVNKRTARVSGKIKISHTRKVAPENPETRMNKGIQAFFHPKNHPGKTQYMVVMSTKQHNM